MSFLSDIFLPDGAQTQSEADANLARQQAQLSAAVQRRNDAGTVTADTARLGQDNSGGTDSVDAAAAAGFVEGAKEGFQNVLTAPGKVAGFAGDSASTLLGGILKNIPWWAYVGAAAALFVWMGGLSLLRGRLSR